MKTLSKILVGALFCSSIASADSFMGISTSVSSSKDENIFGIQPTSELVGSGGVYNEVKYGYANRDNTGRAYVFVWNNSEKNNEVGFGIGADIMGGEIIKDLTYLLGGSAGYGWQGVKGDTARTSTNANKLAFVTGGAQTTTPTTITYQEDTAVLNINLTLGTNYKINNDWNADVAYVYTASYYQVSYRNDTTPNVLNQMSFGQDSHSLKVGLNYIF